MEWTTACPDWRRRILARESLIPFEPLFPREAADALAQFKELKIVDAAGSPTFGAAGRQWVFDFTASIFGAYDHDGVEGVPGRRLINEFFLLISKKNGKSLISAAIMLTALLRNWRQEAEFLILAPTLEIANNAFGPARAMVQADEELSDLLQVQQHLRTITHRVTKATLKVVAADNDTVSGKKATGVLIDELWLFGKRSTAENMLMEATGGLVSRPEGFTIYLSTQSDEPPAGVFKQKLSYARKVRDGEIVDRKFLPVLYEFPPDMVEAKAYQDASNFWVTNPNIGISVSQDWLNDKLRENVEAGESSLRVFLSKHANVEIGMALRADRWAGADYWEQSEDTAVTLDELIKRSEVITIGLDGGGLDDLFGMTVLGREAGDGNEHTRRWFSWSHAWVHKEALERRKSIAQQMTDFKTQGDLTIFENIGDDIEGILEIVLKLFNTDKMAQIGADAAGAAIHDVVEAINVAVFGEADPPEGEYPIVVAVPQGYQLQQASKGCERRLLAKTLLHARQPMMNWCVSNAKTEVRGNAMYVTKGASGVGKIDPLMALLNAAYLMARSPQPRQMRSVYEDRGLRIW